jgi:hypothetical protein
LEIIWATFALGYALIDVNGGKCGWFGLEFGKRDLGWN